MILRRLPFVVLGAAVATLVVMDRTQPAPVAASTYGANPIEQSTPALLEADVLSTSWFCPGGPTTNGRSTSITLFNSKDDPREVKISAVTVEGAKGERKLTLLPRSRQVVNLAELAAGEDSAATVTAYGDGVAVEQAVIGRSGVDVAPCADSASDTWYLADGSTTTDAALRLVLYNPFPDDAVVDISLTTVERTVEPPNLQGAVVPGHSVRVVDLAAAAQREEVVSTAVTSRGAQVVAGRIESADNPSRRGFWAKLATAQPAQTWWFPDGGKGNGVDERFVLYNAGDADASVELSFLPAGGEEALVEPVSDVVPAGGFLVIDVNGEGSVPPGPHSTVINVVGDQTPVVAERVLSRPIDGRPATTVLVGSQLTVPDWYVPEEAVSRGAGSLVIMNSAGLATTVAVSAVGPAGAVPVKGLESVAVPAGGSATVAVPASAGGLPLLIEAAQPVVVEWRAPMAAGDKVSRVQSLAFPVVGGG